MKGEKRTEYSECCFGRKGGFLYFADLYKKLMKDVDLSSSKRIIIPTPYYIVFYNGTERDEEEFTDKLSESFEDSSSGCMELMVRTININNGRNKELMSRCRTLSDYAKFVDKVRKNLKIMEMEKAVRETVEECICEDILKDFLIEQKAEVIAMSIYEYNEDYVKRTSYEEGFDAGELRGKAKNLIKNVEAIVNNFHVDLQKACEGLGITVEEYEKEKAILTK